MSLQMRLRAFLFVFSVIFFITTLLITIDTIREYGDLGMHNSGFRQMPNFRLYIQVMIAITSPMVFGYSIWGHPFLGNCKSITIRAPASLILAAGWGYIFADQLMVNSYDYDWFCTTISADRQRRCDCDLVNFYLSGLVAVLDLVEIVVTLKMGPMSHFGKYQAPVKATVLDPNEQEAFHFEEQNQVWTGGPYGQQQQPPSSQQQDHQSYPMSDMEGDSTQNVEDLYEQLRRLPLEQQQQLLQAAYSDQALPLLATESSSAPPPPFTPTDESPTPLKEDTVSEDVPSAKH